MKPSRTLAAIAVFAVSSLANALDVRPYSEAAFAPHNEANVNARNTDKADEFAYVLKPPSSLQKEKARKVTVNELGKLLDSGFQG